jgi:hypothetical protein
VISCGHIKVEVSLTATGLIISQNSSSALLSVKQRFYY